MLLGVCSMSTRYDMFNEIHVVLTTGGPCNLNVLHPHCTRRKIEIRLL